MPTLVGGSAKKAEPAEVPFAPPPRHSLRGRFNLAEPESPATGRGWIGEMVDWLRRAIFRG